MDLPGRQREVKALHNAALSPVGLGVADGHSLQLDRRRGLGGITAQCICGSSGRAPAPSPQEQTFHGYTLHAA